MERVITVNDFEQRVLIETLNQRRTEFLAQNKPTEDVNVMLLKVIDAPPKKKKDRDRKER
jgi:hypothetical protein